MNELRNACVRAFRAAVAAVQPFERVRSSLNVVNGQLLVGKSNYALKQNVYLAAFGKAALGMVQGAEAALGDHIVEGIASVPRKTLQKVASGSQLKTKLFEGATNNLPDEDSCSNAIKIENMARKLTANDLFLVLISGGGSALLSAPIDSVSLPEKLKTIRSMTSRGADIKQLNIVRRALSRLKGGKLALAAHPAQVISLIISDIVGDPIDLIASAPTVIPPNAAVLKHNPIDVLKEVNAWDSVPKNVQVALQQSRGPDFAQKSVKVENHIISNNETAIAGLAKALTEAGYGYQMVSSTIAENAQLFGEKLSDVIRTVVLHKSPAEALTGVNMPNINLKCPNEDRFALLFGGECTVTLKGNGKGGRNQEIVLTALSKVLDLNPDDFTYDFALLSAGTDGQDGPTEAAGAILTSEDLNYIKSNNTWNKVQVESYLKKNDSYNFWKVFREGACHVITGPTGTNVMDVQVLLFSKKK